MIKNHTQMVLNKITSERYFPPRPSRAKNSKIPKASHLTTAGANLAAEARATHGHSLAAKFRSGSVPFVRAERAHGSRQDDSNFRAKSRTSNRVSKTKINKVRLSSFSNFRAAARRSFFHCWRSFLFCFRRIPFCIGNSAQGRPHRTFAF